MGLRFLLWLLAVEAFLWKSEATSLRMRRQTFAAQPQNQPSEAKSYQPPIPLGVSSIPVASSATLQGSYQPPISLLRSIEHQNQSPHQNGPRTYHHHQLQPGPQAAYVLPPNQPQSVQYIPPQSGNHQSFSIFQNPFPQPATSYSVHQGPAQSSQGLAVSSGLPQSTAERTYSTNSKVVASHVPAQAIHKAPASEIQSDKGPAAKEKDKSNDEYVVYYYYYYDNDTAANNNNLSLNFDDIPSLEAYDGDKLAKEPERSANARTLSTNNNINSLAEASQPRSVGDGAYRSSTSHSTDEIQPLKPVSNVFRYGSNEVPRFPVLPNFIVTEVPTTLRPEAATPDTLTTEAPVTHPVRASNSQPDLRTGDESDDNDDLNNVLDSATDFRSNEEKSPEEPTTTTSTTTTTEPPTTTEEPTTTTERPRRRPPIGGGRRRFNPSPASSFSSSRNRQTSGRSTTSSTTSSTTTTPASASTRRSFQGNRIRPRPSVASNRPRSGTSSRTTEAGEESSTTSSTSTTPTSRSRFTSAAPRRFQSSRSRSTSSQSSSTSTTTTRTPSSSISRSRPTSRPRPNLISRNRPPRPGFPLRNRPGSEPEEPETTTAAPASNTEPETSPETDNDELPSTNNESNETEEEEEEDNETSIEETEEPTTTEGSRFSALFRPRNRNALGNRPRPVIGNRPSRS